MLVPFSVIIRPDLVRITQFSLDGKIEQLDQN